MTADFPFCSYHPRKNLLYGNDGTFRVSLPSQPKKISTSRSYGWCSGQRISPLSVVDGSFSQPFRCRRSFFVFRDSRPSIALHLLKTRQLVNDSGQGKIYFSPERILRLESEAEDCLKLEASVFAAGSDGSSAT